MAGFASVASIVNAHALVWVVGVSRIWPLQPIPARSTHAWRSLRRHRRSGPAMTWLRAFEAGATHHAAGTRPPSSQGSVVPAPEDRVLDEGSRHGWSRVWMKRPFALPDRPATLPSPVVAPTLPV